MNLDFDFDSHLLDEIETGRCVVFAGSEISTETRGAHDYSFYSQIAQLVEYSGDPSFPELIDIFEKRANGRQKLIEQIKFRFDYIDGFRELRAAATRFHRTLAGAPYLSTIITTDWDRYFEEINRATPFVHDSDLALWDGTKRPLLKIHGSIDNLSTIVASTDDYNLCEDRLKNGRLGDILRHIFATKTVLFVGYSATDKDFLSIFKSVRSSMGRMARTHYLVSPFLTDEDVVNLKSLGISPIKNDGSRFVDIVKNHMKVKGCYACDESYDVILDNLIDITDVHNEFVSSYSVDSESHLIFCTSYQDGLIHCLQRIVDREYCGDFANLHHVRGQASLYQDRIDDYIRKRNYWDASYFVGYQTGLIFFDIVNANLDPSQSVPPALLNLPRFYHPKLGHLAQEEFDQLVRPNPSVHEAALKQALRFAARLEGVGKLVPQHPPFG